MKYKELKKLVEIWAKEKGILDSATTLKQAYKTLEECGELIEGVSLRDTSKVKDAIGDIVVTLIIQCKMQKLDLEDCLESAYDVISKRSGKMVNGQFVKDI